MSIASLKTKIANLSSAIDQIEATADPGLRASSESLQASAEDTEILSRMLSRHGIQLRASNGRPKSLDALHAEVSKLDIPVVRRIELKMSLDRAARGLPM